MIFIKKRWTGIWRRGRTANSQFSVYSSLTPWCFGDGGADSNGEVSYMQDRNLMEELTGFITKVIE